MNVTEIYVFPCFLFTRRSNKTTLKKRGKNVIAKTWIIIVSSILFRPLFNDRYLNIIRIIILQIVRSNNWNENKITRKQFERSFICRWDAMDQKK